MVVPLPLILLAMGTMTICIPLAVVPLLLLLSSRVFLLLMSRIVILDEGGAIGGVASCFVLIVLLLNALALTLVKSRVLPISSSITYLLITLPGRKFIALLGLILLLRRRTLLLLLDESGYLNGRMHLLYLR